MTHLPLAIIFFAMSLVPKSALGAQETILRHENYLAFIGQQAENISFVVKSLPRSAYCEDLRLFILDRDSRRTLEQIIPLGGEMKLDYTVKTEGLHVLGVHSGQPLAVVRRLAGPFGLIAWEKTPLHICGGFARHYFYVPPGMKEFTIGVCADVTGEGARLAVWGPKGELVFEKEDDFDRPELITVPVAAGAAAQPWALTLSQPRNSRLVFDDVRLWLGRGLPPFLCERPEWLPAFIETQPSEQISFRQPLPDVSLQAGKSVRVTFTLEAIPQEKMAALRGLAQDVDYPREGMFSLNGSAPYMIPVTGDGETAPVTIIIRREDLKVGENVLEFKHDAQASAAMGLRQLEFIAGDLIIHQE